MQNKFYFSSYWRNWSRVLTTTHPYGPIVELNLTPVPNCAASGWETDVAPGIIRCHSTPRSRRDLLLDILPSYVRDEMVAHLGELVTAWLIEEDFLAIIDPEKIRREKRRAGGGMRLSRLRRGATPIAICNDAFLKAWTDDERKALEILVREEPDFKA
jgi:hypothetical protein